MAKTPKRPGYKAKKQSGVPNKAASADDFLNEIDADPVKETLPGFGRFRINVMSAAERAEAYDTECVIERRINLLAIGVLTESGEPMFSIEQATKLVEKKTNTPERLVSLVMKHNRANSDPEPGEGN